MRRAVTVSLISCLIFAAGCTEVGETTTTSAAVGGAMGAGLGAIVGSTSGDAGAGMVIGGIAGAGAGAAVGNVLQGQEEAIRTQDEAIERQEQMIASQRSELDELRRLGQDSVSFRSTGSDPRASFGTTQVTPPLRYEPRAAAQGATQIQPQFSQPAENFGRQPIREADIAMAPQPQGLSAQNAAPVKGTYDWDLGKNLPSGSTNNNAVPSQERGTLVAEQGSDNYGSPNSNFNQGNLNPGGFNNVQPARAMAPAAPQSNTQSNTQSDTQSYSLTTPECNQAESEARQAESSAQTSDKLFHIRRALRLCPNEARYHNSLGQVYRSLNREMDARFEFEQALALNPNLQAARDNLQSIGKKQG